MITLGAFELLAGIILMRARTYASKPEAKFPRPQHLLATVLRVVPCSFGLPSTAHLNSDQEGTCIPAQPLFALWLQEQPISSPYGHVGDFDPFPASWVQLTWATCPDRSQPLLLKEAY